MCYWAVKMAARWPRIFFLLHMEFRWNAEPMYDISDTAADDFPQGVLRKAIR